MKYIIMCGGDYHEKLPRQLLVLDGEPIIARTIRQLRANGVEDIAISSLDSRFDGYGVPRLEHANNYVCGDPKTFWISAFYPTDYPVCYIFGDVVFSDEAIKTIVETQTDSIEFFAAAPPFDHRYIKTWAEPFALKVMKPKQFAMALYRCRQFAKANAFARAPIMWELWQVIKETPLNEICTNYVVINDFTCDVDDANDVRELIQKCGGKI